MSRPFREGRREFFPEKIAFAAILLSVCVAAFGFALWPRTASSQPGGRFAGMLLIPGGPVIMGREGGPTGESPEDERSPNGSSPDVDNKGGRWGVHPSGLGRSSFIRSAPCGGR